MTATETREALPRKPGSKILCPGEIVLRAEKIRVTYKRGSAAALEETSLDVHPGERIAVIGPSGGGKTTLLRALEGSLPAESGGIGRAGRVALIYQDLRLVAEQTVLANVCCGALGEIGATNRLARFRPHIVRRAEGLLADLGLTAYRHHKVSSLSGGQRQRVAIARALCARPLVLLADEPMGSLDPENSARILRQLARLQKKYGFALLLSTHDPGPDPAFFHRYLIVSNHRIERVATSAQEAWSFFAASETARTADKPIDDPPTETGVENTDRLVQDRVVTVQSPIERYTTYAVLSIVLLVMLGWSTRAVDMSAMTFGAEYGGVGGFLKRFFPESWAEARELPWKRLFGSLLETIQMAIAGTFLGIVVSLPMSILATRQTSPRIVRYPVRLLLNAIRTIPSILWALLFVAFVGLGPNSGVLALAAYSVGYLTKFFYEALEAVDDRPAQALQSLGASRLQIFLRSIFPSARPLLVGACLFVFEYNIRSASILGIVGAGGIGQDLMYFIEWREFSAAMAGLLMVLVVVVFLDSISEWWRRKLTRQRGI